MNSNIPSPTVIRLATFTDETLMVLDVGGEHFYQRYTVKNGHTYLVRSERGGVDYCLGCYHADMCNRGSLLKCYLLSVEGWRDGEGWTWNSWHTIKEDIYIHSNQGDCDILKLLVDWDIAHRDVISQCYLDDDGHNLVVRKRTTDEPLWAFCYGEYL